MDLDQVCLIRVGAKLQSCGPPGIEFEITGLKDRQSFTCCPHCPHVNIYSSQTKDVRAEIDFQICFDSQSLLFLFNSNFLGYFCCNRHFSYISFCADFVIITGQFFKRIQPGNVFLNMLQVFDLLKPALKSKI